MARDPDSLTSQGVSIKLEQKLMDALTVYHQKVFGFVPEMKNSLVRTSLYKLLKDAECL